MRYNGYPKYVTVEEKRAKAEKKLRQLKKKRPGVTPVVLKGTALARSWWGKAWNKNLEAYADYAHRLGRGRSYIRHGAVLDLKLTPGTVTALVMGGEAQPYEITVTIAPILKSKWQALKTASVGRLDSVQALISGHLPESLSDLLTEKGRGLFPSPNEISFRCSCPDSAQMCKHVAATLYGVGARLDEDPSLLFLLRRVEVKDLITETVKEAKHALLGKAVKRSGRVMEDMDGLSDLFGIDLGDGERGAMLTCEKSAGVVKKEAVKRKNIPTKPASKRATAKKREERSAKAPSMTAPMKRLATLMKKGGGGMPVSEMIVLSHMDPQKVRNTLCQMKQKGVVESPSRGVYWLVDRVVR